MKNKENNTVVVKAKDFQKVNQQLQSEGYVCMPRLGGGNGLDRQSWSEVIGAQLRGGTETGRDGREKVPTLFASSGNEQFAPDGVGSKGLGWIEWGVGNCLPNVVALMSSISPYVSAAWKFNTDLLTGLGPEPMYHYTQFVGGNITTKDIPFEDAGVMLRGNISQLMRERANTEDDDLKSQLSEQIKGLQDDLVIWEFTKFQLQEFLDRSNLQHISLALAGDEQMFGMCFPELELNQQDTDATGKPVKTKAWTPRVTALHYRPAHTCRLERMDSKNRINYVYCSNRWYDKPYVESGKNVETVYAYPALSAETPLLDLQNYVRDARDRNVGVNQRPTRFIMPSLYPTPGRPYYPVMPWHSIFAGDIFEYLMTLIEDRNTRKKNSNVIGRIIYLNNDYLQQLYIQSTQATKDGKQKSREDIRDEVFSDINEWLSNKDNSGQSLVAFTFTGTDGKEHESFKIVEIESNSKNSATANQTELQEVSSIVFFAMGLDSKLVGNTPGDTKSSSGTDQRERYLLKQVQMSATQQILLKSLDVVSRFNEWDRHLRWQIKREVLTTLDNSKTGITSSEVS